MLNFTAPTHSVGHYENFPVASWILPKKLRQPITTLYRFARTADDVADEGELSPEARLRNLQSLLDCFETDLLNVSSKPSVLDADWRSVAFPMAVLCQHGLPADYPRALISAFKQDVTVKRYEDMKTLIDYCKRSANPIGRCLLYFYGKHDQEEALRQSDCICTGLQLVNFWQDIAVDWQKSRIYIPAYYLQKYGFSSDGQDSIAIFSKTSSTDSAWRRLTQELCDEARLSLENGRSLSSMIGGRAGFELRLVIEGGLLILNKIEAVQGNVFRHRPTLSKPNWFGMFKRALLYPIEAKIPHFGDWRAGGL